MFPTFSVIGPHTSLARPSVDLHGTLNTSARMSVLFIVGDAFLSLTSLVLAILGLVGVLHGMPPAASYCLIAITGLITLIWLLLDLVKGESFGTHFKAAARLLELAVSPPPSYWN